MRCNNQYDQLQQELGASYKLGNKPASQQLLAVRTEDPDRPITGILSVVGMSDGDILHCSENSELSTATASCLVRKNF